MHDSTDKSESDKPCAYDGDLNSLFSQVLIIEDEDAHITIIQRALRGVVEDVQIARNGREAIDALENSLPDLVLCDLNLPDIHGLDILKAIRKVRPGLPIIVMTSSNDIGHAVAAMREGAWDYMVKDFSSDFENALCFVLQRTAEQKAQRLRGFQLRAERNAFWSAVQHSPDGLSILGGEGAVVFANESFKRFCQLLSSELASEQRLPIVDLLEQRDVEVASALREHLQMHVRDSLWTSEIAIESDQGKDKQTQFFELTLSSVSFDDQQSELFEEHEMPELRKYVLWVREITRKKEQEKFQRDLLSTTTHDLKGPLGVILTSAELLGECKDNERFDQKEFVTRIASCARNSITLIDELLSARRIQDGVLIVRPQWMPVAELLEDLVLDYLPVARGKDIDFSVVPVDSDIMLYADRIGIHRVLTNLVSNAIKYTPKGGRVWLQAAVAQNGVQISVNDNGSGIEPHDRHHLFARYGRLEKHQHVEGVGLGLFVAKNIVEAHNGRIEVHSEVGKGTAFLVLLPNPNPKAKA